LTAQQPTESGPLHVSTAGVLGRVWSWLRSMLNPVAAGVIAFFIAGLITYLAHVL
jgi:hypothetical protein